MGFFTWLTGSNSERELERPPIPSPLNAKEEVRLSAKFRLAKADELFGILLQHHRHLVHEVMNSPNPLRGNDIWFSKALEKLEKPVELFRGKVITWPCHVTSVNENSVVLHSDRSRNIKLLDEGIPKSGDDYYGSHSFELWWKVGKDVTFDFAERLCLGAEFLVEITLYTFNYYHGYWAWGADRGLPFHEWIRKWGAN